MKRLMMVVIVMAVMMFPELASAAVPVNYPGWISEDKDLPGIPSYSVADYKKELLLWAQDANIPLTSSMVDSLITIPFTAGATSPVTYDFTDEKGSKTSGVYFSPSTPLWHIMRDLVFLQTLQHSVVRWNVDYITPIGTSSVSLGEAFPVLTIFIMSGMLT